MCSIKWVGSVCQAYPFTCINRHLDQSSFRKSAWGSQAWPEDTHTHTVGVWSVRHFLASVPLPLSLKNWKKQDKPLWPPNLPPPLLHTHLHDYQRKNERHRKDKNFNLFHWQEMCVCVRARAIFNPKRWWHKKISTFNVTKMYVCSQFLDQWRVIRVRVERNSSRNKVEGERRQKMKNGKFSVWW